MKMHKKVNIDEIDDMLLDDLIKHCEGRMSEPYKEKAKTAAIAKEAPEDMELDMESAEDSEPDMEDEELDDDKKETLRKLYEMMKD